jgi:hypothetical protein
MRIPLCGLLLIVMASGCTDELPSVTSVVNGPEPPVRMRELRVFIAGQSGTPVLGPIEFPWSRTWGFAVAGQVVKICALARADEDDQIFGALSDEVPVIEGQNTHVTMTLAPMEEDEVPSACVDGLTDAGPPGDA